MPEAPAKRRGRPPKIRPEMSEQPEQAEPEVLPVHPASEPEVMPVLSGPVELPPAPLISERVENLPREIPDRIIILDHDTIPVFTKVETVGPVDIIDIEEAPASPMEAAKPVSGKMFWFGETAVFEIDGPANRLKIVRGHHRITDPAQIEYFLALSKSSPSLKIFPET